MHQAQRQIRQAKKGGTIHHRLHLNLKLNPRSRKAVSNGENMEMDKREL